MRNAHYLSDQPALFEYHDSTFELDRIDEKQIAVYVHGLNISKEAEQNPKGYDLEIKKAHILFSGISEFTYDPGTTWKTDENGNSVPAGPEPPVQGEEALDQFREDLKVGAEIWSHTIVDGDHYEIYGCGREAFFLIRFKAQKTVIEWDDYQGPAWYEQTKQFTRKLVLDTPDGEMTTEAHFIIRYDPDELYRAEDVNDVDPQEIIVGVKYKGRDHGGRGTDCSGQDALADLQKQFPEGVNLKCCLSCRYGSRSPFSNAFDLLYCMKNVVITDKIDLCPYITDQRRRCYTDLCEDWAEQREDVFWYSDYPLYLEK